MLKKLLNNVRSVRSLKLQNSQIKSLVPLKQGAFVQNV